MAASREGSDHDMTKPEEHYLEEGPKSREDGAGR